MAISEELGDEASLAQVTYERRSVLLGDPAAVVPQDLRAEDAFHVVVPSLPGMGFSTPDGREVDDGAGRANIRRPIHGRPVIETTERTR